MDEGLNCQSMPQRPYLIVLQTYHTARHHRSRHNLHCSRIKSPHLLTKYGQAVNVCRLLCIMYVLLTKHPGNTVQYMPEPRSREGMYRVWHCPHVRSITHLLHARLGYEHFFSIFLLYSGSESGPYCIKLDWLSGQYHEIWTGLGCRGLCVMYT